MLLSVELRAWLCAGHPGAVATVDAQGQPEICRVWGARAVPDRDAIDILVLRQSAQKTLGNLERRSKASVNIVSPPTYHSIQFKGSAVPYPAGFDADFVASQLALIDNAMVRVGMPAGVAELMVRLTSDPPDYACLRLSVETMYDQSPKMGAGARLA